MAFQFAAYILCWILLNLNISSAVKADTMEESIAPSHIDASDVTWAHAVNSREDLEKELAGTVDFLEADVSMGMVTSAPFGTIIPIMAHPPHTKSDISLEMWMDTVIAHQANKGVKLDFKSTDVVEASLHKLFQQASRFNSSLWLNADILSGPIHSSKTPVGYHTFLQLCHEYFPDAVLSVGWTTEFYPNYPQHTWYYEWKHIVKMADIIRCFGYERHYPAFTFPVRAIFASRSIRQLQWLLGVIPGSSITVWSSDTDPVHVSDLINIRKSFPADKVYYDIPEPVNSAFHNAKNMTMYVPKKKSTFRNEQWMTLTRGPSADCSHYTYISNNTIVFGQTLTTAVLLKVLLHADDTRGLEIEGRVRFFSDYDALEDSVPGNNVFKIVLVDVSLFSKNTSSEVLDLTASDTDVLWSAVNSSVLYTFYQNTSERCRLFKLDTSEERVFQAWTVPCDPINDDLSLDDVTVNALQEVPYGKRVVLPAGPFMVGFVSSGQGHAVVHDFEIRNKKNKVKDVPSTVSTLKVAFMGTLVALFASFAIKRLMSE